MRPSQSQRSWLGDLTDRYAAAMDKPTRSYLADRGIDKAGVRGFRLGLVVDPDPAHDRYLGRLAIPFITPAGVVTMRFRCLEDHDCDEHFHGKYESIAGDTTHLYNVQALHDTDAEVGVCEGELDAIVATLSGLPSVGVPGVNNWKPFYYRLFDDYERVLLLGDGDPSGRDFVATLARNLQNGVRRPLPTGHDVTSYRMEHGPEALLSYIRD